jgi:hypothetical protein
MALDPTAQDYRSKNSARLIEPGEDLVPITPSDSADLPGGWCRGIRCVTDGTFVGHTIFGGSANPRTVAMVAREILPVGFRRILSSGTSGTYQAIY